jgi:hypothetical protein
MHIRAQHIRPEPCNKGRKSSALRAPLSCRSRETPMSSLAIKEVRHPRQFRYLIEDARRDHSALGGLPIDIQPIDSFPPGSPITMTSGILFLTYAASGPRGMTSNRGCSRSSPGRAKISRGSWFLMKPMRWAMLPARIVSLVLRAARAGTAGVRLQNALPRACVLYASATGATKPENLSYASRLGLWGPGTAFADRDLFLSSMEEGGVAARNRGSRP